jgi:hypothetical protein
MKSILSSFTKSLNKDLKIIVHNQLNNTPVNKGTNKIIYFSLLLTTYILSKPLYIYYKGKYERYIKIRELKKTNNLHIEN